MLGVFPEVTRKVEGKVWNRIYGTKVNNGNHNGKVI